jgi:integrase/recombinase XerD
MWYAAPMNTPPLSVSTPRKHRSSEMDKISEAVQPVAPDKTNSLLSWANLYFQVHVLGAPSKTEEAKKRDLSIFISFFASEVGHDQVDGWTPAVSRAFLNSLKNRVSGKTGKPLSPTTINRVMASLRHFGRWLHTRRPLIAGNPLDGLRDLTTDPPDWNGLTQRQILRLKAACEQRLAACSRADQNPLIEAAVFHVLLHTGLREFELASLNRDQYHHRGFFDVARKGHRITRKVPVPTEARLWLDRYLQESRKDEPGPLFFSRTGRRITPQDIRRLCNRLSAQASAHLPEKERFRLNPHQLRHTFLKRVADKHGVHVAQKMSGNISIREIFRYTQPNQDEIDQSVEDLF